MVSPSGYNPFALLTDPASVMGAVESSAGLSGLKTRVFRPLDRGNRSSVMDADLAAYDAEVDTDSDGDDGEQEQPDRL